MVRKKASIEKKKCGNCKKEKPITNFYNTNSKFSEDGKTNVCKTCIKDMVNVDKIETVYEVLQLMNIPFISKDWEATKEKAGDTFGNYIRKINSLPQYQGYTYKDSVFDNNIETTVDEDDTILTYSKEWRGNYNKDDLQYLEEYYRDLNTDFKIVTKNHKDYARKIAKASLAMDKAYEDMIGGVSGSDKRYKDLKETFDTLSKSAQFSENTRGANDVSLGSFGVVFDKVEQKRWIPQHTPLEKDDYDKLIDYFSSINKSV